VDSAEGGTHGAGHDRSPAHETTVSAARGGEPPALPTRHGAGVNQPTDQHATQGGIGEQGGHRLRDGAGADGGLAPPIGGASGCAPSRSAHLRLGFLIDEDCAFDGDPGDHGWVSPPVIGA
jgi:hypothetical protein